MNPMYVCSARLSATCFMNNYFHHFKNEVVAVTTGFLSYFTYFDWAANEITTQLPK